MHDDAVADVGTAADDKAAVADVAIAFVLLLLAVCVAKIKALC